MKDANRPSAAKKVQKPVKSNAMQKNKAKPRKVHKKPAQAQTHDSCSEMDDVIEENQEEEQQEELSEIDDEYNNEYGDDDQESKTA